MIELQWNGRIYRWFQGTYRSTEVQSRWCIVPQFYVTDHLSTSAHSVASDYGRRWNRYWTTKITALRENSNYFRAELSKLGLHVVGNADSPIIPVMIYFPAKIAAFSRECLKRGLAVVVVGFPATDLIKSRSRFCISSGHTRQDLQEAIRIITEVADILSLRYEHRILG